LPLIAELDRREAMIVAIEPFGASNGAARND
jgi:hypothetical protein